MKQINLILLPVLFFICCNTGETNTIKKGPPEAEKDFVTETIKNTIHKDLAWAKVVYLGDLNIENFDSITKLCDKSFTNKTDYDNFLIVTSYFDKSGCTSYEGNIAITGDTIFLKLESTTNITCTELEFYKVTYIINNPTHRKFKLKKK